MTLKEKLRMLLDKKGRGARTQLAKHLGVSPVYITRYSEDEYDDVNMPSKYFIKTGEFFDVNPVFFLSDEDENMMKIKLIPLIGIASCGVPNISYNDAIDYIPVNDNLAKDGIYAIKADGDSMLPNIQNGDILICDKNSPCLNGNIVHYTTIDGDSGVKKYLINSKGVVTLMPLNSNFNPVLCDIRDLKCAKVVKRISDM